MSYQHPAQGLRPADNHRGLRLLALTAVVTGLLLLAAAAFVLSYAGIHEVALSAGVSRHWARLYPLIFDAMLVIAGAAVLSLRGAGLPSRCYAWVSMLALLAAAAGADTVHATDITLPPRPTAAAAAIIPWAVLLIGFGLLLCMLRQARLRRAAAAAAPARVFPERPGHVEVRAGALDPRAPGSDTAGAAASPTGPAPGAAVAVAASASPAARPALPSPSPATPPTVPAPAPPGDTSAGRAEADVDPELDLALEADPGPDDPASDEGSERFPRPGKDQRAEDGVEAEGTRAGARPASVFSAAPTMPAGAETEGSAPGPGPVSGDGNGNGTFPGLVAKPRPDGAPISQLPPHPRVAPESTFEPQPGPEATAQSQDDAEPEPEEANQPRQPHADAGPEPEAATQPNPQRQPAAAQPDADAGPEPEAEAQTQPGPSPDPQPAPPPHPRPAPDAQPTRHTPPQPRPAPESGTSLEAAPPPESEPAPNAAAEPPAEPEPGADAVGSTSTSGGDPEPASDAGPPPAAPQFDRMRSSPVPPEA
jgi:uncharacterized protein DUF2637